MVDTQHVKWLKDGVDSWNTRRSATHFQPNLKSAHLRGTKLAGANLTDADLRGAWLDKADLREADCRGAVLSEASFENADLSGSTLRGCDLSKTNFSEALLVNCDIRDAILDSANLRGASLENADLRGASLRETNVLDTNLTNIDVRTMLREGSSSAGTRSTVHTDFSTTMFLEEKQLNEMVGDAGTVLPYSLSPPSHWFNFPEIEEQSTLQSETADENLQNPIVRASALDFAFTDNGVEAVPPEGQDLNQITFTGDSLFRATNLIEDARAIAASVSNKLGEDTRADLLRYADHLEHSDTGNPHRLVSICVGIRADLEDEFVSSALGHRLQQKLTHFLQQHDAFLKHCLPETAEAAETKANTELARDVTKEEATEVLNQLEEAISIAEAATSSFSAAIADLRAFDDHLNALKVKVFQPSEKTALQKAVQRETVELGSFGARLYWRAKQVLARTRLHAGDVAIVGTLAGKNAGQMATAIVQFLEPVMRKLGELIPALPPL